ncbi:MAG: bacterial transcriptional activator domain-containing protein [Chloroflexi bacterium]|nr:bacterial transcriptional activator domain-containing protein [Chloroflexota bacterium]MBV9894979.1 bacterial transcriptional activator domain-containing protein [Chloroflexota bacterium]
MRVGDRVIGPSEFPGPQAELVLAILALNHLRPVASAELAYAVWWERASPAWRGSLRALVSRVRAALAPLGGIEIRGGDSWYQLVLPTNSQVDCLRAIRETHDAEALLAAGAEDEALPHAVVASMIAARPVLPEVTHPWVDSLAARMQDVHLRALDALVHLWTLRGQYAEAILDAETLLRLDPLHESGYAGLMQAHLRSGNPTMGLRVYERCRQTLRQELGSSPGPKVEGVYRELLGVT